MIGQLYTLKTSESKHFYDQDYIKAIIKYGVVFKEIAQNPPLCSNALSKRILVDYIFKSQQDKEKFMKDIYYNTTRDPMVISTLEPYQQKIKKQLTVGDLV